MTNGDNDFDIDGGDEFEDNAFKGGRESLKETWDSSPLMKIGAVVLGVAVLAGGYFTFFTGEEEKTAAKSVVSVSSGGVRTTPGGEEVDEAYRQAVEDSDRRIQEEALRRGESAMPTPIGTPKDERISVPEFQNTAQSEDPLREWRMRVERQSQQRAAMAPPEEEAIVQEAAPDVVPMVQPVRPQAVVKMDPQVANAMAGQMRLIITSQAPAAARQTNVTSEMSLYEKKKQEEQSQVRTGAGAAPGTARSGLSTAERVAEKLIVSAGTIAYAQNLTELNSDLPGPVLAQILSGPFTGGRAIGAFQRQDEYLTITFRTIVKDGVNYRIDGIALDEETTLSGHRTDIDRHYFQRIILPAAAKFVEGYASAASKSVTQTTTTPGGGVVQNEDPLDTEKELMKGVEEAAKGVSDVLDENSRRPITVKVARGTTFGILFMTPVTTENAGIR